MRSGATKTLCRPLVIPVGTWTIVLLAAWFYGQYRIGQLDLTDTTHGALRIAVVQTNVPQDNKNHPTPQQLLADWQRLLELTHQASQEKGPVQLIVWPETMVPAGLNREAITHYQSAGSGFEQFHLQIQAQAQELNTYLMVGAHAYDEWKTIPADGNRRSFDLPTKQYNTVYLYQPNGTQEPNRYDKIHRVPFGEYIPWVEDIPPLKRLFIKYLSPYDVDYSLQPGQQWTVFPIPLQLHSNGSSRFARVSTPICFEDTVARVIRAMVFDDVGQKRSDLLINLTNDGWYAGTNQGPQHLQIAVLRCVENRVPMARSVNTGISGFIDSVGRIGPLVVADGQSQQIEGVAVHTMVFDHRQTLFGRWGHATTVTLLVIAVIVMVVVPKHPIRHEGT